jgi:hypothetical protein
VISAPHRHEHANVNFLASIAAVDPLNGMTRYSGLPADVYPAAS